MITAFLRHLRGFPVLRRLKHSLKMRAYPVHPVDVEYGIKTSAPLWAYLMQSGIPSVDMANNGYLGSQPSAIRHALSQTGDISEATFIDIGSGKGRALAVATEFPFRRIMGLEISKELCRLARSNAQIIERKFPARTKIEIIEGNAIDPPLAPGLSVIFFFNSFGPDLTSQLLSNIERRLRADDRIKVFFLYYNPLHYDLFDASKQFHRYAAENYAITTEASGSSRFQDEDGPQSVVTYQSRHADMVPQRSGAGRPVRIKQALQRRNRSGNGLGAVDVHLDIMTRTVSSRAQRGDPCLFRWRHRLLRFTRKDGNPAASRNRYRPRYRRWLRTPRCDSTS